MTSSILLFFSLSAQFYKLRKICHTDTHTIYWFHFEIRFRKRLYDTTKCAHTDKFSNKLNYTERRRKKHENKRGWLNMKWWCWWWWRWWWQKRYIAIWQGYILCCMLCMNSLVAKERRKKKSTTTRAHINILDCLLVYSCVCLLSCLAETNSIQYIAY